MGKIFIGIDPGQTGALASIDEQNNVRIFDYADASAVQYLWDMKQDVFALHTCVALLEKVNVMPKQGIASSGKFMRNAGKWEGRLELSKIPFSEIAPNKWQKAMFTGTAKIYMTVKIKKKDEAGKVISTETKKALDTKAMSLTIARRLFPQVLDLLKLKKNADRADALLMAEYCRRYGL